ncbi:phosphosulfolactate synthase [Streptomyces canus]|uniref:phosphosulfolactate synthase n=1 Tax=Streptomyces canus TaxID=58343 RepID=UPI003673A3B3
MTYLQLPIRESKPRRNGRSILVDPGLSARHFQDVMESFGEYIDLVKFGWGTALVTRGLNDKISVLKNARTGFFFGGTLFEKSVVQGRFDKYREFCHAHGARHVEVSNGVIDLTREEKAGFINKLAAEFEVLAEVGFKDGSRSELHSPSQWIDDIHADLGAGAHLVILEARETGSSGICRPDGRLRFGLIEEILNAPVDVSRLVFEAPTKTLQSYFIQRVGPDVNLGNISAADVIALETLRLGLRADTFSEIGGSLR